MGNDDPLKIGDKTRCYICGNDKETLRLLYEEMLSKLEEQISKKKNVEELDDVICNLGERVISIGEVKVTVPLCFICQQMFNDSFTLRKT
jgi:uncharacterized hydantoinase/oxoprolinase family protein